MSKKSNKQKKLPISVVMVVYNEEKIIERAIKSCFDIVDEIIVVHDGPCRDNTIDIVKKYTDKIYIKEHIGEAEPHRVFTYQTARNAWILQLDADEYISTDLRSHLEELINDGSVGAYALSWPLIRNEKTHLWGYKTCLFNKNEVRFIGSPHEYVKLLDGSKKPKKSHYAILHEPTYENLSWSIFRTKWTKWANIHASSLTTNFSEIEKWNCNLTDWEWRDRIRLNHPILFGLIGSSLYHFSYNFYHFLITGETYFLKQGYYSGLYFVVLYYYVNKNNVQLRRTASR